MRRASESRIQDLRRALVTLKKQNLISHWFSSHPSLRLMCPRNGHQQHRNHKHHDHLDQPHLSNHHDHEQYDDHGKLHGPSTSTMAPERIYRSIVVILAQTLGPWYFPPKKIHVYSPPMRMHHGNDPTQIQLNTLSATGELGQCESGPRAM